MQLEGGVMAVFHALRPVPAFLDTVVWEAFRESMEDGDLYSWLQGQKLIIDGAAEDDVFRDEIVEMMLRRRSMSILYLVLTKACNFRCRQCFQPERHPEGYPEAHGPVSLMTLETARLGIDAFARHIAESDTDIIEPQVYLYGGEPLLNWRVLKEAVLYAKSLRGNGLPEDIGFVVITNGSLIDDEKARFFAERGVSVGLSIDGPKGKNDSFRVLADGDGTYDQIVSGLRMLQEHGVSVTLSITINPNIASDLPGIVRWAKEDLGVEAVSFNLIGGASYAYTGAEFPLEVYNGLVAYGLVAAFQEARRLGAHEDRVGRKVEDFVDHLFKAVDCGAVNNQLVIQPDGAIAFCHVSTEYNVGSVHDPEFRIFDHPAIQEWEAVLPVHNPKCQSCPAMSICGYGCFHHVRELGRPLDEGDDQFCLHTRRVMEFLIRDLLEKTREQEAEAV
jgi:uncharacterized protein